MTALQQGDPRAPGSYCGGLLLTILLLYNCGVLKIVVDLRIYLGTEVQGMCSVIKGDINT